MTKAVNTSSWVDGWRNSYDSRLMSRFRSIFFDMAFFDHIQDKNAATLDVGCGTGFFIRRLLERGYVRPRGIEPDARLVPSDLADRIDIGSATALPYPDASFDCIYFFNVLHHLPATEEYAAAMAEARRCLKPEGKIIFLEPNWRLFYVVELFSSKILGAFWRFSHEIHAALADEWELLMHFFDNKALLRNILPTHGYAIIFERHIVHQWIVVYQKPPVSATEDDKA